MATQPADCFNAQAAKQVNSGGLIVDPDMDGFGRGKDYSVTSVANPEAYDFKGIFEYFLDLVTPIEATPEQERTQ